MKITKYMMVLVLALCLVVGLCACGGQSDTPDTTETPAQTTETLTPDTTAETEAQRDDKVTYSITVVDQDGNPMPSVMVQICLDTCLPGLTNESGVAQFTVEEAAYKVSLATMPEGYSHSTEETEFYFEDGSYEMTITLNAAA